MRIFCSGPVILTIDNVYNITIPAQPFFFFKQDAHIGDPTTSVVQ